MQAIAWISSVLLAGIAGAYFRWKADRRDSRRLEMQLKAYRNDEERAREAYLRARLTDEGGDEGRRDVNVILTNEGRAVARDVTFEVTSIHNPGCHVVAAPVHVPISSLLPGQNYSLVGSLTMECPEPLLVTLTWEDEIGKHQLEMQLTSSRS